MFLKTKHVLFSLVVYHFDYFFVSFMEVFKHGNGGRHAGDE